MSTVGLSFRIIGGVRLPAGRSFWVHVEGRSYVEISVPDGIWYVAQTGNAQDIITELNNLINAADPEFLLLSCTITDGFFELQNASLDGRFYNVSFEDPAGPSNSDSIELQEALGVPPDQPLLLVPFGLGPTLPGLYTSEHGPPFNLHLDQYFFEWAPRTEVKAAQARSKSGRVKMLKYTEFESIEFDVGLTDAWPHQGEWSEWHSFRQFMSFASKGLPFRVFPDEDNLDPFVPPYAYSQTGTPTFSLNAETANPLSWMTLQLNRDTWGWAPEPWGNDGGEFSCFRQALAGWFYRLGIIGGNTNTLR